MSSLDKQNADSDNDFIVKPPESTFFTFYTPSQLRALCPPEPEYLIEGLLPKIGTSIVAGKPKEGKSTVVRNIVAAVTSHSIFLGRQAQQGPVLLLQLEDQDSVILNELSQMNYEESLLLIGKLSHNEDRSYDPITQIKGFINYYKPALVVLDPWIVFSKAKDINDYNENYGEQRRLKEIARKAGTHIMLVHHSNKGETGGQVGILGSTALSGAVDTMIFVERKETCGFVWSRQRVGQCLPRTSIELKNGVIIRFAPSTEMKDINLTETIIEKLEKETGGILHSDLTKAMGIRTEVASKKLIDMVRDGQIESRGSGHRGDPKKYYSRPRPLKEGIESDVLQDGKTIAENYQESIQIHQQTQDEVAE